MSIKTFFIGGIINAADFCRQNCSEEHIYPTTSVMTTKVENFSKSKLAEIAEKAKMHYQNADAGQEEKDFWKLRILALVGLSPAICSVSFLPFDLKSNQTWFMQKGKSEYPVNGFYAPFAPFNEDPQSAKEWGVIISSAEVNRTDYIATNEDIVRSIDDLSYNQTLYNDVSFALKYFLLDSLSGTIGLTFYHHNQLITRLWVKKCILY